MGFFKKIVDALFGSAEGEIRDPDGIYLYVKCGRCGAPVRVRADKRHDLQRDYDTNELILHKEIMDGRCFSLMQATVRFAPNYRIVDQQLEGGEFISWEEYRDLTRPSQDQGNSAVTEEKSTPES
ncbi:MAG: hypothetical protein JXC32_09830 [Anaerolineae bacterium]|nr:hypothetical protein [Anaerolineae bacterium]